jgi:heme-degrading monooxygenase HmoA
MIARLWRGAAAGPTQAQAYLRHLEGNVLPALEKIPGHRGVRVLRREEHSRIELLVMTFWESMDAVRAFAGADPERAVVEPEARAVLADFDDFVRHYEVER